VQIRNKLRCPQPRVRKHSIMEPNWDESDYNEMEFLNKMKDAVKQQKIGMNWSESLYNESKKGMKAKLSANRDNHNSYQGQNGSNHQKYPTVETKQRKYTRQKGVPTTNGR
jgi:hypothetical protein